MSPLLEVSDIHRSFGGLRVHIGLSFSVEAGAIFAVIGPNGAGKSTLFQMISGFLPPDSGDIRFETQSLLRRSPERIARGGIGRTFQTPQLSTDVSCLENVSAGLHSRLRSGFFASGFALPSVRCEEAWARSEAERLLEFVGLRGSEHSLAGTLSFGRQRLLELARALGGKPRLLLLDEPAAGLNDAEIDLLKALIIQIRDAGCTVLLIEHHMDMVMDISDRIVVIHAGHCISNGVPHMVRSDPDVIEAYLGTRNRVTLEH